MTENIVARTIVEIMGSPKEHVENAIKLYIDKIEKERDKITITKKFISDVEEKKDLGMFSAFAELDLDCENISELVWFSFDYMPASIEIIEPSTLTFDSVMFTNFFNDLLEKLHKTDGLVKSLRAQNTVLGKNSIMLMKNLMRISLKEGDKNIDELSKVCGVPSKDLIKFLNSLEKEGRIKKDGDIYKLIK